MKISKMRLTCKCGHVFDGEIVVDAPMAVALASMKAIRCPKCGNHIHLGMGGELAGKPKLDESLLVRADWWRNSGDTGISSLTIYGVFAGEPYKNPDVPHDPSDFGRCRRLLDLIPEWHADIGKVASVYPWYLPFTDRWSEFDRLWNEESSKKIAPQLYHAMQVARVESLRIQFPKAKIITNEDGTLRSMN